MAETVNIAELKLHQVWVCVAIDTYWILNSSVKIESVTTQKPFHQQLSVFFKKSTDLVLSEAQLNFRQYKKFNCKNRSQSTVTLLNSSPFRVWNIKSSKQCQWKILYVLENANSITLPDVFAIHDHGVLETKL